VQGPLPGARPHLSSAGSHTPDWQTLLAAASEQVATRAGSLGRGSSLASLGAHMPSLSLHHSVLGQSLSRRQPLLQRPLFGSQTLPEWPVQLSSEAHFPHVPFCDPDRKQNGAAALSQGSLAEEPRSPLHFTHVECSRSQIGVAPLQASDDVHSTQLPVLRLQIGASPEQCASSLQLTQVPWAVPLLAQRPERQTLPAFSALHGPTPLAKPHSSSRLSHTPLTHTNVAAASLQFPSRVGLWCGASLGNGVPFPSNGKQAPMATLHHLPAAQSVSTLQPFAAWHRPLALQLPERHTTAPLAVVHGP